MYYYISFYLQKGEGFFPNLDKIKSIFSSKDPLDVIKENMKFSFNNDNHLLPVDKYIIIDNGFDHLRIDEDGVVKGPMPVIWLMLKEEIDPEDINYWQDAMMSDYKLSILGINNDDPFFFQDHNGYSKVIYSEHMADDLWERLEYWAQKLDIGQKVDIDKNCSIVRKENLEAEPFNITLEISCKGEVSTWGWTFESEKDLTHFEPSDKFYSDRSNCEYPEENPSLYFLHKTAYLNK